MTLGGHATRVPESLPSASGPPASPASTFNFKHTIAQMVQRNASDLLLKVGRPPTIRLNGELHGLEMPPVKPEDLKLLAEQVMTPRQVKEFAEKKEADFAIGVPGVGRFIWNDLNGDGKFTADEFDPLDFL